MEVPDQAKAFNTAQIEAERDTFTAERYLQFARHLGFEQGKVLDVGCATGRGGVALKNALPDIELHGLDFLQHRLDRLPEIYAGSVCSTTTAIDVPDQCFDAIVAGEFIEHISYSDGIKTLAEFHRVLRPGGRLLMTTPYPDYIKLWLTRRTTMSKAHISAHYPKQLKVMMNDAGFQNVGWTKSGKMTRALREVFPMACYGSFLIWGDAA